jgi:hypothetical protein
MRRKKIPEPSPSPIADMYTPQPDYLTEEEELACGLSYDPSPSGCRYMETATPCTSHCVHALLVVFV